MIKRLASNINFWYFTFCFLTLTNSIRTVYLYDKRLDYFLCGFWSCWMISLIFYIFINRLAKNIISAQSALIVEQQKLNKDMLQSFSESVDAVEKANKILDKYRDAKNN